jgi:hypothetical protein
MQENDDLKKSMKHLTSALDSKRQNSNAAVCGIILPIINTTMVMTTDESSGMSIKKLETCFEAFLKFAAKTYQSPNVKKGSDLSAAPNTGLTPQNPAGSSGPQLQQWTESELAAHAAQRASQTMPNMEVWKEEDLIEELKNRTGVNLPTWTEEELEEENKRKTSGGLNVPEWKTDDKLVDCPKCAYTCKPEWGTCPMCDTPLAEDASATESEQENEEEDKQEEIKEQEKKEPED